MLKNLLFATGFLLAGTFNHIWAQEFYTGYHTDNYAGMTAVAVQPAEIVDNRYKFHFGASMAFQGSNNYSATNFNVFTGFVNNQLNSYRDHNLRGYRTNHIRLDIINGMFEINHKNAIGYSMTFNNYRLIDGLPADFTAAGFEDFTQNSVVGVPIAYKRLMIQRFSYFAHNWYYGRVLKEDDEHYLKAAGAFKIINGANGASLYSKSGTMQFQNANGPQFDLVSDDIKYGVANNDESLDNRNSGIGLDLGIVYEFRPDHDSYVYDMDGETNIPRYDVNKYKFKVGVSLVDIGRVKFFKDTNSFDFSTTGTVVDGNQIMNGASLTNNTFNYLSGSVANSPTSTQSGSNKETFNMSLPTALNIQADYHIWKGFYAAYSGSIPIAIPGDGSRVYNPTTHSITPRYESMRWSIMTPFTIKRNGQFNFGITGRIAAGNVNFFMGSHNLTFLFGQRRRYDQSFFAGVSFGLRHRVPKDRDKDKVSDQKDRCPDDPGLWEYKGCPDTDGDGLIDLIDHCIYDAGDEKNYGCPDRDNDGVIDVNDRCPDNPGLAVHYGCPDRDKDGVIDAADRCPDVPGIELNNGCPFENQGCCMDNDGDGISNAVDKCPEVSGSVYNEGCPVDSTNLEKIKWEEVKPVINPNHTDVQIKDTLSKGSTDIDKGKEEEPKQIEDIKDIPIMNSGTNLRGMTVYFDHNQAYLEDQYIKEVNKMIKDTDFERNPKVKFIVIGHTDNVGSDNYNLLLSKRRAETVKKHLINQGVPASQIEVYYYGEWQPLYSNDNEKNKGINRRCEIQVMRN
ncbi:MAG: DUF5723 family protein [Flavobacteriales bacterium]|nr:DUF5723 family protein [Flavobacteriales bacterium]